MRSINEHNVFLGRDTKCCNQVLTTVSGHDDAASINEIPCTMKHGTQISLFVVNVLTWQTIIKRMSEK